MAKDGNAMQVRKSPASVEYGKHIDNNDFIPSAPNDNIQVRHSCRRSMINTLPVRETPTTHVIDMEPDEEVSPLPATTSTSLESPGGASVVIGTEAASHTVTGAFAWG